jgi:hypothetical protein
LIVQRIIFAVTALAALAAAAVIVVFAAAFALYALLRDVLTPAGAAAVVCLAAAILAAIVAFIASRMVAPKRKAARLRGEPYRAPPGLIDRVMDVARERPFVAAGAAVAAGLLAIANPAIVTAAMRAFFDPTRPPRR